MARRVYTPWGSKPPNIVRPALRIGHWSTNGLVGAWIFNEQGGDTYYDLTSYPNNGSPTGTRWSRITSTEGRNIENTDVGSHTDRIDLGNQTADSPLRLSGTTSCTIIARASHDSQVGGNDSPRVFEVSTGSNAANGVGMGAAANGLLYGRAWVMGNGGETTVNVWVANEYVTAGFRRISGSHDWWADGTFVQGITGESTDTITTGSASAAIGNAVTLNNRAWGGRISLVYVYNRALSDEQMASITANPWQALAQRPHYYPVSAAPSGYIGIEQIYYKTLLQGTGY